MNKLTDLSTTPWGMMNDRFTILTGNHRLLKSINSTVIRDLVRTDSPISGAQLAKITGMRPSTVQKILKNLESQGLVTKIGIGASTKMGGRPPTLWEICGHHGYAIGIQLEMNEIRAVLVNLKSQIIAEQQVATDRFASIHDIEEQIIIVIKDILQSKNIDRQQLLGIGIGVSGLVDVTRGIILRTSLLRHASPIPLRESLQKHYDIPIYIENDANAAALAEKWFGARKKTDHFVFVLVVVDKDVFGIGFGLVLKHDIYRGANMLAGEATPYDLNIKKILRDQCGFRDAHFINGQSKIDLDDVHLSDLIAAIDENPVAKDFFDSVGKIIADELTAVINLLDPQMIVIGGEIAAAKGSLFKPVQDSLRHRGLLLAERQIDIVPSSLPVNSVSLGAVSIILQQIFQEPVKAM
ncbi:ROK family protein [candidate division KSB1 bacterium]|nr:ROK family protein [candidate division KSB1 bacterium]RQW06506.1 MAG: ROK family transcriptional regulator [candidate division KSB1 bacterium]